MNNTRLIMYKESIKILETKAFIGKNGITKLKKEGDGKTPLGKFYFGIAFGTHEESKLKLNNIKYVQINKNSYWIDDSKSKFYNQLVDIRKVQKDWNSAEHLIEYPKQYEYGIEIKINPKNISKKGSAIFLHCSVEKSTAGCVAIHRKLMYEVLKNLTENASITIEERNGELNGEKRAEICIRG